MRQNGLDRVRIGDICDHPQCAAAQRADRNIDIKYTLKPLCPAQHVLLRGEITIKWILLILFQQGATAVELRSEEACEAAQKREFGTSNIFVCAGCPKLALET
jgi:hypothetical protein